MKNHGWILKTSGILVVTILLSYFFGAVGLFFGMMLCYFGILQK